MKGNKKNSTTKKNNTTALVVKNILRISIVTIIFLLLLSGISYSKNGQQQPNKKASSYFIATPINTTNNNKAETNKQPEESVTKLNSAPTLAGGESTFIAFKKIEHHNAIKNLITKQNILKKINLDETLTIQDFLIGNYSEKNKNLNAYKSNYSKKTIYLRPEVLKAFLAMKKAAKKDGVTIGLISGFRSHKRQQQIWNGKWMREAENIIGTKLSKILLAAKVQLQPIFNSLEKQKKIIAKVVEFSAAPGMSRHHWGTDIDVNSLRNSYFTNTAEGRRTHKWLEKNAMKYGFIKTYYGKRNRGHSTELWHYSYFPTSIFITAAYSIYFSQQSFKFLGKAVLNPKNYYNHYFLGLNPKYIQLSKEANLWPMRY